MLTPNDRTMAGGLIAALGVITLAAPIGRSAEAPTVPATLEQARSAIDFMTFPRINAGAVQSESSVKVDYETAATIAESATFYRDELMKAGWKIVVDSVDEPASVGSV